MTYRGRVQDGVVVLDEPAALPDGTVVSVQAVSRAKRASGQAEQRPTLYERLKPIIGKAKGLPADFSVNHDHYLYGTPKK
ncbi:MAG TPA: hypothetical protein VNE39_11165 [Planctomycetota bacterium]|nr:hypothetical protein [Planctomycetota bacterium]